MKEQTKACRRVEPLLAAYMDNELPSGSRREVEEHLSVCHGCRRRLEDFRRIGALVAAAMEAREEDPAVDEIWPGIEAAMGRETLTASNLGRNVVAWGRRHMRPVWIVAAAAILLIAILPGSIHRPGETSAEIKIELEREDVTYILSMFEKTNTSIIWIFEEGSGGRVR